MSELPAYVDHQQGEERTAFFLPLLAAALILALIGVVSVVTGGGDDGGLDDPAALVRAAPDALQEAGSARMALDMAMDGGALSIDMGGEGVLDFVTGAATFEMSMFGESIELRTDGATMWLKMPAMALPAGVTGTWLEVPVSDLPGTPSTGFPGAATDGYVDILRGLSSEVEELGSEEIDGVDTTHLRFEVSVSSALEQLDEEERATVEQAFSQLGGTEATFPVDLWITDDGLPIRQVMEVAMDGAGLEGTMRIQVDLSDFGVDVVVEPPPPEEIVSFDEHPELEEMFGSGAVS